MPTIQIRDIPDDIYDYLRKDARANGKSLQSYMRDQVINLARKRRKIESSERHRQVLERVGPSTATLEDIVATIREVRGD
ncbi:hypothetical protein EV193_106112 [Herbihabitans rhizosphaerae]|uniref:Antitoxin FitA-like ribbon-helix-helix domain-containing protein n=1 Tax=Herbihabitans rhizosphaerae TaxID=1872711 RepID=A0A4Q7KJW5_9PSEU|nr:antitoxin [Herbihabitans rhizosphaerae]RZS36878.1 hypothetical protein EV193_106112 [Herbihabitans rhizosphaerae]